MQVNENKGKLKVYFNGKRCNISYCKVYSRGSKGDRFYRDGYTDIASTFRYALDQKDISEYSILVLTDFGGMIHRVNPPSFSEWWFVSKICLFLLKKPLQSQTSLKVPWLLVTILINFDKY